MGAWVGHSSLAVRHGLLSLARTLGSNPSQGMEMCVRLFCVSVVLCVGSGLETG
jgi:hypothetical protein